VLERLRRNRAELAVALGAGKYAEFSPLQVARCRESARLIEAYARGRVLDVGCGHMIFRSAVLAHAVSYEGLDVAPRVGGVHFIDDACEMRSVPSSAFDTVLCFEVLEHLAAPERALAAIAAVLRPGGTLLVTVPHLSRLHEEPHDFFRYTGYGLRALAERVGLEVLEVRPYGGLATFLGHQVSTGLLGSLWSVRVVREVAYQVNRIALVYPALWVDRLVDRQHLFATGYALAARRPL
jgi:SAM-dependent methyltransferase